MEGSMTSPDDQMLDLRSVAATRDGHSEAFGDIVKRYQDRMFNTIYRLVGDYQEAKDLTQQTFLRAYMSLDRFKGMSSFYTWLYRIGVNASLDERKKRSRQARPMGDAFGETMATDGRRGTPDGADDPAESTLRREREQHVTRAIASLDELHRAVLVLRDIEGMEYDRISEVLSVPRGPVKSRLHRARLVLKNKLTDLVQ
ncbi:MAG TPA: sigma-70 family RNA polymerase sigma factor [Planctomycetota bacterium]|nr:sigma-70 family RNA polymerase sigma factor [Planctomycetota bacterium]